MGKKRVKRTSRKSAKRSIKTPEPPDFSSLPPPGYHRQAKQPLGSLPHLGLKLLYGYTIALGVLYFFYFLIGLYFPDLFPPHGHALLFLDALLLIILFYVIYGMKHRKYLVWKVSMLWYAFAIVYSIFLLYILGQGIYIVSAGLFALSSFLILIINGIIIWYIYHKEDYFLDHTHHDVFGIKDKFFVYSMVCFLAMVITISLTVSVKFYHDTTQLADSLIHELRDVAAGGYWEEGYMRCAAKSGAGKDVCFVVLATLSHGRADYCNSIASPAYRFSCRQAVLTK